MRFPLFIESSQGADIIPPGTTLRSLAGTKYARNVRASIKSRNRRTNPNSAAEFSKPQRPSFCARKLSHVTADRLDQFARVFFALAFVVFNAVYWPWYLV